MITLGLDCGTQSTKCIALDLDSGEIRAAAQKAYGFVPGLPDGSMEQHPEDWSQAAGEVIASVLDQLGGDRSRVRSIGVSGQQHGLVVLDESDRVIRPAKLWCDTSTAEQCATLTKKLGGVKGAISETGNAVLPGYTAPKILWIKEKEPKNYTRIRSVLLPHDYLNFWLTGRKSMEFGDASGTGLLNVATREWSSPAVSAIGDEVRAFLPELQSSCKPAGFVRKELLSAWNLPGPILVSAGGGDNMMGAIGTGNIASGKVTVSLGTSGTLYAFSESPVVDNLGEVAAFCDSTDHWLPLVCTMNVTLVTELVAGLFGWGHAEFEAGAAGIAPGSDGLLLLPYLTGERTPNLPNSQGLWTGLTTKNMTPGHLARSAMEGVTFGLAYGLARFRELGISPSEIRLTGGGSNSGLWRQMCADIFQVPTVCLKSGEGAALGAAIQAAWTWESTEGADCSLEDLTEKYIALDETTRRVPDSAASLAYQHAYSRAQELRSKLQTSGVLS